MTDPNKTGGKLMSLVRGGTAPADVEQDETAAGAIESSGAENAAREQQEAASAEPREYDESVVDVLAAKILMDWLRNRQQLLVPFTLELQKLDHGQIELLVHAMVAAARADGALDGKERSRVEGALEMLRADEEQRVRLTELLDKPKPLADVLADVRDVQTGAIVYAASLLAIDQRRPVNRHYLRYLASRLQLPEELARSLQQRFRAAA